MSKTFSFDDVWRLVTERFPPEVLENMRKEEIKKLKHVNILISGKSGVGKTTLVNRFFGHAVGKVGRGRPVTDKITWYEPPGVPLRLCDTKGLELKDFQKILDDLKAEIQRRLNSGRLEDRIHIAWICIAEPGERVEEGEQELMRLCSSFDIPVIVVLTKAIGPADFINDVRDLLPEAASVVRVLTGDWVSPHVQSFGLKELLDETYRLIPDVLEDALTAAQNVDVSRKRSRAIAIAVTAAAAAASGATVPVPGVGLGSFVIINIGMLVSIAAVLGVELTTAAALALAMSAIGALALSFGARMAIGEALKLVPGLGSLAGAAVEASAAAASTYGIGHAFTEYLLLFHRENARMPDAEELKRGFEAYWDKTETKSLSPI